MIRNILSYDKKCNFKRQEKFFDVHSYCIAGCSLLSFISRQIFCDYFVAKKRLSVQHQYAIIKLTGCQVKNVAIRFKNYINYWCVICTTSFKPESNFPLACSTSRLKKIYCSPMAVKYGNSYVYSCKRCIVLLVQLM